MVLDSLSTFVETTTQSKLKYLGDAMLADDSAVREQAMFGGLAFLPDAETALRGWVAKN
jgi:hypothetical protein